MAKKTFVLSDDSLNSYRFRILTAGIDIEQLIKNPMMLFMHNRYGSTAIGRWENIRKEDKKLLADAVFDLNDPFAKGIADKVENNFLRMASLGVNPVETSSDPKHVLPGQQYETVTKSIAREASIVDIGSNDNALALCDIPALYNEKNAVVELSALGGEPIIPSLKNKSSDMLVINLTDAADILGLAENATEQQVKEAVRKLKADKESSELQLANLVKASREKEISDLVDGAVNAKKITAAQKDDFRKLAATDFETCKKILDAMKPYEPVQTQLADGKTGDAETDALLKLSGEELWRAGKLETLKTKNPEAFKLKYKEFFGAEPK